MIETDNDGDDCSDLGMMKGSLSSLDENDDSSESEGFSGLSSWLSCTGSGHGKGGDDSSLDRFSSYDCGLLCSNGRDSGDDNRGEDDCGNTTAMSDGTLAPTSFSGKVTSHVVELLLPQTSSSY